MTLMTSISWVGLLLAAAPQTSLPNIEAGADATMQLAQMNAGQYSARQLTSAYLLRIEAIDRHGPRLNAVIELNPDALAQADARDAARKAGSCGPLCGLPILIKDNIDVAGAMATSAGSLALAQHRPDKNAELVDRIVNAGAVILGKTNLSEWANFRSPNSSSGWSSRGGQTRNPHVLDRSPCGSSSGSGAAMAAQLAALTVGTETDGSIICPSSINSIVGVKPTVGWVSQSGIIPISSSQDTAGPMTRSVRDAALLLGVMAGNDRVSLDFSAASLRNKRLGIARQAMGFNAQVDQIFENAVKQLRTAGAEVIDVEIPNYGKYGADEFTVLKYEFKAGLNAYLASAGADVNSLAAVIAFNQQNANWTMPWFGQETLIASEALGDLSSAEYRKAAARAKRLSGSEGALKVIKNNRLDALIAPSNAPAWRVDWVNGDNYSGGNSAIASVPGYPNITVPMGQLHGLPLGLSFIGAPDSDNALLQIAHAFEQLSQARVTPKYQSSVEN
jgi:amidase